MKGAYVAAALGFVVLAGLSAFSGFAHGDLPQVPMQWSGKGVPTCYEPKWIGLGFFPIFHFIIMSTIIAFHYKESASWLYL